MQQRIDFRAIDANAQRGFSQAGRDALAGGLDPVIKQLTDIRASQMNGCAFCLDMHVVEWKRMGEDEHRLHLIVAWREAGDMFSARERAALAWTEAITHLEGDVPDDVFEIARAEFTEKELVYLTVSIAAINAHNRMNVAFRSPVGSTRKVAAKT